MVIAPRDLFPIGSTGVLATGMLLASGVLYRHLEPKWRGTRLETKLDTVIETQESISANGTDRVRSNLGLIHQVQRGLENLNQKIYTHEELCRDLHREPSKRIGELRDTLP